MNSLNRMNGTPVLNVFGGRIRDPDRSAEA
jgi:hypothetical protein